MSIAPRCEECGEAFDVLRGGICQDCGRMLCGTHLHGLVAQFFAVFSRGTPRCGRCRGRRGPAGPDSATMGSRTDPSDRDRAI